MSKESDKEEKVNYLRIALNLQGIGVTNKLAAQILETIEKINDLGGEFTIQDAVDLEMKYKDEEE